MTNTELNKGTNHLLKMAADPSSSFIGRYLAARNVVPSIMANKRQIMDDIDPNQDIQNNQVMLSSDQYKQQREKAYEYMPQSLKRQSSGPMWKNLAAGGLLGGGLGAAYGGVLNENDPGLGALVGGGAGALLGASSMGLGRLWNKFEQDTIRPEDIAAMKARQKDRGMLSDLVPFRDVYDAATA